MLTITNPYIAENESLGFTSGDSDEMNCESKSGPPEMMVSISKVEVEDVVCPILKQELLSKKEIKIVFEDTHIWLKDSKIDFEAYFSGEYKTEIIKAVGLKDSVVLDIKLVFPVKC